MNDRQWNQRRSRGNMRNAEGEHHIEIIETQWSGRKKSKNRERKKERNEEQMTGNWIRDEGKKNLREAWGTRGGTLEL